MQLMDLIQIGVVFQGPDPTFTYERGPKIRVNNDY
jgi:hypothetical protein